MALLEELDILIKCICCSLVPVAVSCCDLSLHSVAGVSALPWKGGAMLVIISVILTLIGGLIPSRIAAKKDPVIALRSE